MVMRICTIGDSFTYGDEIADFMLPGFPGYVVNGEWTQEHTEWNKIKFHVYAKIDEDLRKKHSVFREENRWSSIMSNELAATVDCLSSNGKSIYNYVTELIEYLDAGNSPDLVVIQLTSVDRYQLYCTIDNSHPMYNSHGYFQFILGMDRPFAKNAYPSSLIKIMDNMLILQSTEDTLCAYLYVIKELQYIVKLKTGKNLIIVDGDFKKSIKEVVKNSSNEQLHKLIKIIDFDNMLSMQDVFNEATNTHRNPGAHYCFNTHKLFGLQLANLINKGVL
jgi:hypothetical protein